MCLKQVRQLTDVKPSGFSHHDLESSRIRKNENAVQSLVNLIENEWVNPFNGEPTELISLSTGVAAPSDIARDRQAANGIGEAAYKQFQEDQIESRKVPFHDTLPKQKLKTFSDVKKVKVAKEATKKRFSRQTTSCLVTLSLLPPTES